MYELLAINTRALTFSLQTLVEQGISLPARLLLANGIALAPGTAEFPAHLRYGVPDIGAKLLASSGVRHRSASVLLGRSAYVVAAPRELGAVRAAALAALQAGELEWRGTLGDLIYGNTLIDLTVV